MSEFKKIPNSKTETFEVNFFSNVRTYLQLFMRIFDFICIYENGSFYDKKSVLAAYM